MENSITHEIIEPGDYFMENLIYSIENPGELICIGDGCGKYIDIIEDFSQKTKTKYTYIKDFLPDGKAAAELALRKYKESPDKYSDYNNTIPFYTRQSDAENAKTGK